MTTQIADPPPGKNRERQAAYDDDVILWAEEQARLLRAGRFAELDIEHIADEIEDVGKSEKRELASRIAVLLAHLIKWQFQPARRGSSLRKTISLQRRQVEAALKATPSLKVTLRDPNWQLVAWGDALLQAIRETGLEDLPEACPWSMDDARNPDFWTD